ncbi:hypothetical protein HN873_070692 [Arachis hypogaea]
MTLMFSIGILSLVYALLSTRSQFLKQLCCMVFVKSQIGSSAASIFSSSSLVKLKELEADLLENKANNEKLQHTYNELVEYKLVLEKVGEFFSSAQNSAVAQQREHDVQTTVKGSIDSPLLLEQETTAFSAKQVKLGFISGLVPREKSISFERILFRATRGNVFMKQAVIDKPVLDPISGEKVDKNVFVVFYFGERVKSKILKICDAFGANRYPFSDDLGKQFHMIREVSGKLSELKTTIDVGLLHWNTLVYWTSLRREKAIYHTLNMLSFNVTRKCLLAEGWCPVFATRIVTPRLEPYFRFSIPRNHRRPIFTQTNLLLLFNKLVAKCQEANPGVYTIITFPFLFAIMFGDWGHGICILLASLYLVIREKKYSSQKLGNIMQMAFGERYVIVMMEIFSIYTGFIYNEFFSIPFAIFAPSAYACRDPSCRWLSNRIELFPLSYFSPYAHSTSSVVSSIIVDRINHNFSLLALNDIH